MSESYTRKLLEQILGSLEEIAPGNVFCELDGDIETRISQKLSVLGFVVALHLPRAACDGEPMKDDWKMTFDVTVRSIATTRSPETDSFAIAEEILSKLNNTVPETEGPNFPIFNVFGTSIKHEKKGNEFFHTITFTARSYLR